MAKGDLLGHIDCPSCGTAGGMRITEDKNGNPFGYCEADCDQQMRIGGLPDRVNKFFDRHPNVKRPGQPDKMSGSEIMPPPAKSGMASALELLGVK